MLMKHMSFRGMALSWVTVFLLLGRLAEVMYRTSVIPFQFIIDEQYSVNPRKPTFSRDHVYDMLPSIVEL